MATRDANLTFSSAQAITANTLSTNIIDLSAIRNIGVGRTPYVVVQVTTTMGDSGNNSNCTVTMQTDSVSAFNSATNTRVLGVFATNAAAGTKIGPLAISPGEANEQYLGLYYEMGGGDLNAGAVTAFITFDPQLHGAYPDAITVSVP